MQNSNYKLIIHGMNSVYSTENSQLDHHNFAWRQMGTRLIVVVTSCGI